MKWGFHTKDFFLKFYGDPNPAAGFILCPFPLKSVGIQIDAKVAAWVWFIFKLNRAKAKAAAKALQTFLFILLHKKRTL